MENLKITNFYNFLRSTTFILVIFSCDFILSIQNLNFKNINLKQHFERVNDFS